MTKFVFLILALWASVLVAANRRSSEGHSADSHSHRQHSPPHQPHQSHNHHRTPAPHRQHQPKPEPHHRPSPSPTHPVHPVHPSRPHHKPSPPVHKPPQRTQSPRPVQDSQVDDPVNDQKVAASNRLAYAEKSFAATNYARFPSQAYWGGEIIYQIQVDRFNNGNVTNDDFNLPADQVQYAHTPNQFDLPMYRHGGDIEGITQRLDYLDDLGVTALWVTPILTHTGAYHGYCTTDPTSIDAGFGTADDFRTLVQEAHKRNIFVFLDIVVNHLCDLNTSYSTPPNHAQCPNDLDAEFWSGTPGGSGNQGALAMGPNFFAGYAFPEFFSRCGTNSAEETDGETPAAVYGDFVNGMFDFDTRNWDFQEIFTLIHQYWIAYADIDGFRMDAAKHVTEDFIAYFSTTIRSYASTLGKDNFFIVGEVAADSKWEGRRLGKMFSDPSNPNNHGTVPQGLTNRMLNIQSVYLAETLAPYPGLDAVYNFEESGTSRDVLLDNRAPSDLAAYFTSDDYNTLAGQNDVRLLWTHLEIHDWPRYLNSMPSNYCKGIAGLSYLLTMEGMPIIEYGQEQGFNGVCNLGNINAGTASDSIRQYCTTPGSDSTYRQDMFLSSPWRLGSAISYIDSLSYIGSWESGLSGDWHNDPFLNRNHDLYKTARALTHVRQACRPLREGTTAWRMAETSSGGLLAFSRLVVGAEILVIVNTDSGFNSRSMSALGLDNGVNQAVGQIYRNLFNTQQYGTTGFSSTGEMLLNFAGGSFSLNSDSFAIFVHENNIGSYNDYLGVSLCTNFD